MKHFLHEIGIGCFLKKEKGVNQEHGKQRPGKHYPGQDVQGISRVSVKGGGVTRCAAGLTHRRAEVGRSGGAPGRATIYKVIIK